MNSVRFRQMTDTDIPGVVGLQAACFPPPFPAEQLWQMDHLRRHLEIFPEGQMVAEWNGLIIGSASSCLISEDIWLSHLPWEQTLGGYFFNSFTSSGNTLYGADISVHPEYRKLGVGRGLYQLRFDTVKKLNLTRYGTACRLPGYAAWREAYDGSVEAYCRAVVKNEVLDRTLTPLLRFDLNCIGVIHEYMEDAESCNAAALLEWKPI